MTQENLEKEESIDLKEEFYSYLAYWKWFLVAPLVTLILGFIYLRYAERKYNIETSIVVKDEKSGTLSDQMSAFADLNLFNSSSNIENEVEVLKSRTLAEKVVDSLKLQVTYLSKQSIRREELYDYSPIVFNITSFKVIDNQEYPIDFVVDYSKNDFSLTAEDESLGIFTYGKTISYKGIAFSVTKSPAFESSEDTSIAVSVSKRKTAVKAYQQALKVDPASKTSSVLKLSLISNNPRKAADYLNSLVSIYNKQAIQDKRFIAETTSKFITNRLEVIALELGDVEKSVENYKNKNNISDIKTEIVLSLQNLNDFQKSVLENQVQIKVVNDMLMQIQSSKPDDLLPSNYLKDNAQINAVQEVNKLIIERNKLLQSDATIVNPNVVLLEKQIQSLKSTIISSLKQQAASLLIIQKDLEKQEKEIDTRISKAPRQEREFRIIDRQQKVKEALYLYLLQKREETNISIASTELNAKIIDKAVEDLKPVAPKTIIVLLACLVLGFLIPFAIIYLIKLFDTKIKTRLDLEGKTDIPFLGDVPTSESHNELMKSHSNSSAAEAIRIVRTNLEFMLTGKNEGCKSIFTTSTFSGEGKTFLAINLAATIALSGKKVLLVGLDVRNPKLNEYVKLPNLGVTNYLTNSKSQVSDYIVKIDGYPDFNIMPSGTIPPNPAELLMNPRLEQMFIELKEQFDYLVVDTAPVGLVADTLLFAHHADMFLYVIRANKLDKKLLHIPQTLYTEKKLPNMALVLNDTDSTKGYGYAYGYRAKETKTKKRFFKRK